MSPGKPDFAGAVERDHLDGHRSRVRVVELERKRLREAERHALVESRVAGVPSILDIHKQARRLNHRRRAHVHEHERPLVARSQKQRRDDEDRNPPRFGAAMERGRS